MDFSKKAKVMGIINLTPDSFSDGAKFMDVENALKRVSQLLEDGVDIIDLGAESTRPDATEISAEEEWRRLENPLVEIRKAFPKIQISVDTYKGIVAKKALDCGANIINDVWGGMWGAYFGGERFSTCDVAGDYGCKIILTHNRPKTAKAIENLEIEIFEDFKRILENARACGVSYKNIILDGGFGFAKTPAQNLELLRNYWALRKLGFPLLLGLSRKSTIKNSFSKENLELATLAFNMFSLSTNSSDIIRVHDVKNHKLFTDVASTILESKEWTK